MVRPLRIGDDERRARLVVRQHLDRSASGTVDAVRGVVALHATDPTTPPLALWARVPNLAIADVEADLYDARVLCRRHAMRRTLFVVPAADAAMFDAAVGADVAAKERRRLETWLAAELSEDAIASWLADAREAVLDVLADGSQWRTQELVSAVPALALEVTLGSGKWATRSPVSSRLLFVMAMEGEIVRARPAGSWRSSQYRWAAADRWWSATLPPMDSVTGRAALAARYLATHGPVTLADVRWWTGWTATSARAALADVGAVTVRLDSGDDGYVLPDDVEAAPAVGSSVALLPGLDSTTMGYKDRGWYLGPHRDRLFDRNGNAGPTVWVDGRIVGGWGQRPDGEVVLGCLEDLPTDQADRVAQEARALTDWLAGEVVSARFPTPLERELSR